MEHGCSPCGNAKARAVAWNLPDPVPVHREPIYTPAPRPASAKVPDRCRTAAASACRISGYACRARAQTWRSDFPIILTSGRLVEYEGGGEETRSNKWLAELQQEMFVEINPARCRRLAASSDGELVWVLGPESNSRVKVKALVTDRVGQGVAFMPFHFGGFYQGEDRAALLPAGTDPIVLGESANTVTTYGYDPVTFMQETKVTLCQIRSGVEQTHGPAEIPLRRDRCIECNACVTACKNEHEVPWGINRRRVVTLNDGKPGERCISMACMHCTDAPCAAVCPVNCFYTTADGVVLHDKDLCIGCGYCFYACPSARRNTRASAISAAAARWTSAPTAPAGRSRTTARRNTCNTAATASPRASCRSAPRCAHQGAARRRRRHHRRHLQGAGAAARLRLRRLGLAHRLQAMPA